MILQMTNFWHQVETKLTSNKGYAMGGARTGPRFMREFKVRKPLTFKSMEIICI